MVLVLVQFGRYPALISPARLCVQPDQIFTPGERLERTL